MIQSSADATFHPTFRIIAMEQTKITVRIYTSLLRSFDKDIQSSFFKRDAFLNHILKNETAHLAEDLNGKRLSSKGRRYISGELKRLDTTPVNLVVEKATAEALNAVVEEANIVRDAFVNRVLLYLRSSSALLRYLDLPEFITGSEFENYVEPMPTSPMRAIEAILGDPFYYLRTAVEERLGTGLYTLDLPPKIVGFSCLLNDVSIPGTAEYEEMMKGIDELLAIELDELENEAFQTPKEVRK